MTVQTFDAAADALTITAAAAKHLQQQLQQSGKAAVRISVKESGCTGYRYVMDEVQNSEAQDIAVHTDNGLQVFVDPKALALLKGTEIDYEKDGLNRTIKFNNPNVTAACGCGESFSTN